MRHFVDGLASLANPIGSALDKARRRLLAASCFSRSTCTRLLCGNDMVCQRQGWPAEVVPSSICSALSRPHFVEHIVRATLECHPVKALLTRDSTRSFERRQNPCLTIRSRGIKKFPFIRCHCVPQVNVGVFRLKALAGGTYDSLQEPETSTLQRLRVRPMKFSFSNTTVTAFLTCGRASDVSSLSFQVCVFSPRHLHRQGTLKWW